MREKKKAKLEKKVNFHPLIEERKREIELWVVKEILYKVKQRLMFMFTSLPSPPQEKPSLKYQTWKYVKRTSKFSTLLSTTHHFLNSLLLTSFLSFSLCESQNRFKTLGKVLMETSFLFLLVERKTFPCLFSFFFMFKINYKKNKVILITQIFYLLLSSLIIPLISENNLLFVIIALPIHSKLMWSILALSFDATDYYLMWTHVTIMILMHT